MTDVTATIPSIRIEVRVRNVRGVLLVVSGSEALELSESATFIWRQLDGRRNVHDVAALLAAEYEIDMATAVADTAEIIDFLASRGFVTT